MTAPFPPVVSPLLKVPGAVEDRAGHTLFYFRVRNRRDRRRAYSRKRFGHEAPRGIRRDEFRTKEKERYMRSFSFAGLSEISADAPGGRPAIGADPLLDLSGARCQVRVRLVCGVLIMLGVDIFAVAKHHVVLHCMVIGACFLAGRSDGVVICLVAL